MTSVIVFVVAKFVGRPNRRSVSLRCLKRRHCSNVRIGKVNVVWITLFSATGSRIMIGSSNTCATASPVLSPPTEASDLAKLHSTVNMQNLWEKK